MSPLKMKEKKCHKKQAKKVMMNKKKERNESCEMCQK